MCQGTAAEATYEDSTTTYVESTTTYVGWESLLSTALPNRSCTMAISFKQRPTAVTAYEHSTTE